MSAVSSRALSQEAREGRKFLPLISGLLVLALPALAVLPESLAASTAVRLFIVLLVLMAAIDLATLRVPNILVYSAIAFALFTTLLVHNDLFLDALVGGAGLLGLMFLVALVGRGAMGMGDVKAGSFVGCCLGLKAGFMSLLFGFAAGGVFALVVLSLHLRRGKDIVPLTPFITAGAIGYGLINGFLLGGAF